MARITKIKRHQKPHTDKNKRWDKEDYQNTYHPVNMEPKVKLILWNIMILILRCCNPSAVNAVNHNRVLKQVVRVHSH